MGIHTPNRGQINHQKSIKQNTAKVSNAVPQKRLNMNVHYSISNGIMQDKKNN